MNGWVSMPVQVALLSSLFLLPGAAKGQVAESAVRPVASPGFHLPNMGGNLTYAVTASESVTTGFYSQGDEAVSTNVSGDLAYLSESRTHPFSAIYSGGVLAGNENQPTSVVQNLALSQVYLTRLWDFTVADTASYLPSSPTTGLSGVAGLGDLGLVPVENGPITGQPALTNYATRVSNNTSASISGRITGKSSVNASGSFALQRFTADEPGLIDSNQAGGSLGASHTLNARSSVSADYSLFKITYSPDTLGAAVDVQSANFELSHQFNRSFSADATVGPQWVSTYLGGKHSGVDLATDLILRYQTRLTSFSASYVRGTNSGFGIIPGGFSNSVNSSVHRTFLRIWNAAATVNYTRTTEPASLNLSRFSLETLVGAVQASRSLTRSLSTYVSYNAQHQNVGGLAETSGAFRGFSQTAAVGLTYSPRTLSLGSR